MFDATSILGAVVGRSLKKKSSLGTVAATAAGAAAVGGLGYLAYQHFQQKGAPQGAPPAQGWGGPPQGAPPAQGWGGPPQGAPPAQGWGAGPAGAAAAGGAGVVSQFTSGLMGASGGLRTDGFSGSSYGWQAESAAATPQPAAPPAQSWGAQPAAPSAAPPQPADPSTAPSPEQASSLLLLRAMIAAIHADGVADATERARIVGELAELGLSAEDRAALEQEIDHPKPIALLASEVKSPELAEQFYTVSLLAIDVDHEAERAHLRMLPALLRLTPEVVAQVHQRLGVAPPS
jgi:uncharacterized membrane protein YebE (DUF533 family)